MNWAIIRIQSGMRQYLARKRVREKAYKRYNKIFDPNTMSYYYINLRTHKTQWTKPLCLGSYDIEAKNHWIALKDNDGDTYYYNPQTWLMQWEAPVGVVFCDICGKDNFAILLLSNDNKFYCERHMNEKAEELIQNKVLPRHIKFKEFDGSIEESLNTNFKKLIEKNWQTHIIELTRRDKCLDLSDRMNKGQLDSDEEEAVEKIICSRCDEEVATIECITCNLAFCHMCYDRKHKYPPWTAHIQAPCKQPVPNQKKVKRQSSTMSIMKKRSSIMMDMTEEKDYFGVP
jgi:hypothetical protein